MCEYVCVDVCVCLNKTNSAAHLKLFSVRTKMTTTALKRHFLGEVFTVIIHMDEYYFTIKFQS